MAETNAPLDVWARRRRPAVKRPVVFWIVLGTGLIFLGLLALAPARIQVLALIALVAGGVMLLLVDRPAGTLCITLGAVVLFENERASLVPATESFYRGPPALVDVLIGVVVLGLLVQVVGFRRPLLLPGTFTLPLLVLGLAACAGTAAGYFGGADRKGLVIDSRGIVYLVVIPILVVNLLGARRQVRMLVSALLVLCLVKEVEGITSWIVGAGRSIDGTTVTFYAPTANFLLMLFLAGVCVALVARIPVRWWVKLSAVLAIAVLVLSYRRSFWIALPLSLFLAVIIASGPFLRPLILPLIVAGMISGYLVLASYGGPELSGPVGDRFKSLSPTSVQAASYDRYRIDEAKNVRAEIARHPVAGIGLGTEWKERYPLPVEVPSGHSYTHVVVFWFWLRLGVAGAVAYAWLMFAAVGAGLRIWRWHDDPIVRVAGAAVAASLPALAVAETTASWTGTEPRFSVVVGGVVGWLAAAAAQAGTAGER